MIWGLFTRGRARKTRPSHIFSGHAHAPELSRRPPNLGRLYQAMGRTAEAELQLRAAVALAPLNVRGANELGSLYLRPAG